MPSKNVVIGKKIHNQLLEDKKRLDFMDKIFQSGSMKVFGVEMVLPKLNVPLRKAIDLYKLNYKP